MMKGDKTALFTLQSTCKTMFKPVSLTNHWTTQMGKGLKPLIREHIKERRALGEENIGGFLWEK